MILSLAIPLTQKKAAHSDPFFNNLKVYMGQKSAENFQYNMKQHFTTTKCQQVDWKIQNWSHKCYMKKEVDHHSGVTTDDNIECIHAMVLLEDELLLMKW